VTTTFATIGSGRRTRFFLRLARAMPERLRVSGVVTGDPGRVDALTTDWGVPAFGTVGDLLRYERPDYIAAAVPWAAMPDAIREVVGHRMPVLAETPPA
jgi:predicted dehydrogenase